MVRFARALPGSGRSINSEAVEILAEAAAVEASLTPIVDRLREIASRIDLPPDAPTPEELIRELRHAPPGRLRGSAVAP